MEKVRQSSDPDFTQILNRIRDSSHVDHYSKEIKSFANQQEQN